jgi:hypothetical protein
MPVRIAAPDGSVIEFPDGTDDATITDVMRKAYGGPQNAPAPKPAVPTVPENASAPNALGASNVGILQGLTANFGDEIMGGLMTPIEAGIGAFTGADAGKGFGQRIGDAYDRALTKERGYQQSARAAHPYAALAGDVAGSIATGGTMAKGGATLLNVANPTMGNMIGRAAAEGALYGGAYGAGEGQGAEDRLRKAAIGAGVGGASGAALGAIAGRSANKAARSTIPTADDLKAQAQAAYRAADQAGLQIAPESFEGAVKNIAADAQRAGIDRDIHPKATAALRRLQEASGTSPTLQDAETLRRVLKGAAASVEPDERRISGRIIEGLDSYISSLKPSDVVSGDPQAAVSALGEARDFWGRYRKSDMIERALEGAKLNAAGSGSGGNVDNATRQALKSILKSQKLSRGFTEAEREALTKAIKGTPTQNALRLVGKLSPQGGGLMAALGLGATAANPMMAAAPAAGMVAKRFADQQTTRNVASLLDIIRSGGNLPQAQALSGPQRALLEAVLQQSATTAPATALYRR